MQILQIRKRNAQSGQQNAQQAVKNSDENTPNVSAWFNRACLGIYLHNHAALFCWWMYSFTLIFLLLQKFQLFLDEESQKYKVRKIKAKVNASWSFCISI